MVTRDDQGTAITRAALSDLEPVLDVARKIVAGEAFTDLDSIRVATALLDGLCEHGVLMSARCSACDAEFAKDYPAP